MTIINRKLLAPNSLFPTVVRLRVFLWYTLLVSMVNASELEFEPAVEYGLLRQHYESGMTAGAGPFTLFVERCQKYAPQIIQRNNLNLTLASLHFRNGDWQKALELYHQHEALPAEFEAGLLFRTGQCQAALGQHKQAAETFRRVLTKDTLKVLLEKTLFALAAEYGAVGDYKAQDETLNTIIKSFRSNKVRNRVYLMRAEAALRRGMVQTALKRLMVMVSQNYIDDKSIKTIEYLKEWEKKAGWKNVYTDDNQLKNAAHFCFRVGDFRHALALFLNYQRAYPTGRHASFVTGLIADCYYRLGEHAAAIDWYERKMALLKTVSERQYYIRKQARCYQLMGQYDRAIALYMRVVNAAIGSENTPYALLSLAYCHELTGQTELAIEAYWKLENTASSDYLREEAVFRRAMIFVAIQDIENALADLEALVARKVFVSRQEDVLFWLAKLHYQQGNLDKTAEFLSQLLDKYPASVYREAISSESLEILDAQRYSKKLNAGGLAGLTPADNPYEDLRVATIDPHIDLVIDDQELLSDSETSYPYPLLQRELKTNTFNLALMFRFHLDFELALDYYAASLRADWQNISLLMTMSHFQLIQQNYRRSLYYAEAIRSLFKDHIDWSLVPWHRKRLFFPLPFYDDLAREAAAHSLSACVPAALIYQESRFEEQVISSAGARGLMQIMPETGQMLAREVGLQDYTPDLLLEHQTNVRLGTHYLKKLIEAYHGNLAPALAAYNGGQNNVDQWMTLAPGLGVSTDFADLIASIRYRETRDYVKKVLVYLRNYCQLYCQGEAFCPSDSPDQNHGLLRIAGPDGPAAP